MIVYDKSTETKRNEKSYNHPDEFVCGIQRECTVKVTTPYREQGTNYPEPRWAGPTPAYGLFARHVDGLKLHNVEFELLSPDERPDIILEDVIKF